MHDFVDLMFMHLFDKSTNSSANFVQNNFLDRDRTLNVLKRCLFMYYLVHVMSISADE